jgi:hypothetical protein
LQQEMIVQVCCSIFSVSFLLHLSNGFKILSKRI